MSPAGNKPRIAATLAFKLCKRISQRVSWFLVFVLCAPAFAGNPEPAATGASASSAIVIGFLGGFVHRNDARHAEVQLAEKLRQEYGGQAKVGIFENHRREEAHAAVVKWLDRDGDAVLSQSEKHQARIVLYGHSWGGSAVLALARELEKDQIPVLLTIQVDSIAKPGINDRVVPPNVVRAVNFYQTGGALHGEKKIVAADPSRTEILGDFRLDYKTEPAPCSSYPWFARHFLKGHTAIECDPNVWSRIESMIQQSLFTNGNSPESTTTALQQSPPVP
jgi:hypothetical protein